MSQRSGAGSQRGAGQGSQRSHASVQPPSNTSGSQRGAQEPPPVGTVEGRLYKHPRDLTPNNRVRKLEDEYQNSVDLTSLSLASDSFPSRPGFGTQGREAFIWANYFHLLVNNDGLIFYQYHIDIQPEAVGRKRARIIELFLNQPQSFLISDKICCDFKSTLLSRVLLADDLTACNVAYRSEFEDVPGPSAPVYHLRLKHTKPLHVHSILESLTSTSLALISGDNADLIQAFNIFLNHFAKSQDDLIAIGSKTFPKNAGGFDLGRGLVAIRGFFSSVRAATGRILINVNVCCSAFLRPGPLGQFMETHGIQDMYQLEQMLRGARVKTSYRKTTRIRSIVGLASPRDGQGSNQQRPRVQEFGAGPERVQFWFQRAGRYVSVFEFFQREYQVRANARLPVVNVGSKANPVYLPANVCEIMAGQKARGRLDTEQTSRMIQQAVRRPPPAQNALSIARDGLGMIGLTQQRNRLLGCFGVDIDPNFLSIPCRILPKPGVAYRNRLTVDSYAAWNIRGQRMSRPATIPEGTWGWLYITMTGCRPVFRDLPQFQAALDSFRHQLRGAGINIGGANPRSTRLQLRGVEDPQLEQLLTAFAGELSLIYIILPTKHTGLYNRIKQICDIKVGLVNICSVASKLLESNGRPQYFGNIGLKFNLKGGGENQTVEPSRLHFVSREDTMIVGIDVTHPSPNSSRWAPSVAAMVASIDAKQAQYRATSFVQMKGRQEMIDRLTDMLKRHLSLWRSEGNHRMFPQNILVYRDGVSEGQYSMVKDQELPLLQRACKEVYGPVGQRLPSITIVIVAKRHQTRFGPLNEELADRNGNCLAGTVVDRGITRADQWEFYIQAHAAIQGHARPAHYVVVHDEIFRSTQPTRGYTVADTLEDVTQSLHFTYGRSTRAVSYCTPAYYADRVCDRIRRYIPQLYDPSTHSDTASVISNLEDEEDEGRRARLQELITPHPRVVNKMYWI